MKEQTRAAALGLAAVLITGGVLLWATSPGVTLKREYESGNGKPVDGGRILQEITLPVYNNVQAVTAREACDLHDGILVLAYPGCPYCRNLMPELAAAAKDTDTRLYYCELNKYRDVYTYDSETAAPVLVTPAGEGYAELLAWLGDCTHEYVVKDPDGNGIPVGEQRISMPTLLRVRGGTPAEEWKYETVESVTYPKDAYERWDAQTQTKVYESLCQYLAGIKEE